MLPNQRWPQNAPDAGGEATGDSADWRVSPPQISLPKGGGAIRGIGEKFAANPVTGTGSMTIPIATSPGRSGFGPQLSLAYDSGAGNGPFGLGWHLAVPAITRKTDKGLPRYRDEEESDVFVLAGAEDLVPVLVEGEGGWTREAAPDRTVDRTAYRIRRYRPRIEGPFAQLERWTNATDPADCFWRAISRDNLTTWYGRTPAARITDPADPARIFSWLLCETYDDRGNAAAYEYKPEDSAGIDPAQAHERNRTPAGRSSNRYLKRIRYGNRTPYLPVLDPIAAWPAPPGDGDWLFEVVLDYGEHDAAAPQPGDDPLHSNSTAWPVRSDPFSTYRAGFEVRTYRLCRRVLMFHHATGLPAGEEGYDGLVRSTDFTYADSTHPADARYPVFSFLTAVAQCGYQPRPDGGYRKQSLPPVEFGYSEAIIQSDVREIDAASLENLPTGLDGSAYQWVDLDGEGLAGILTEQAGGWFYKRNLSPLAAIDPADPARVEARFGPVELAAPKPAGGLGAGQAQFLDLAGDGQPDLVRFRGPTPGFHERTPAADGWEPFTPFASLPVLDWDDPNLRLIDLTGDGHADILLTEDEVFRWHPSLAEAGFGPAEISRQSRDEETGPRFVFADGTQSIHLADMSGDGLTDLVRIRNGEVCYWPNLGYGRFGAKVTMDDPPWFDRADQFDPQRIRLADIDGSGTTDLIYLHGDGVRLHFNQSGNRWSHPPVAPAFPRLDRGSAVAVLDLLGTGTACLVWSSTLPGEAGRAMRYLDLMGGQKPHLLVTARNNRGTETTVQYTPSTRFYLADRLAGRPWITRLPFPVQVVEKVTVVDHWRRATFATTYSYHHGYFDGVEREFRGFGRVEQVDTEDYGTFAAANPASPYVTADRTLYQPPVKTITWFHTGAALDRRRILTQFAGEYFPQSLAALPAPVAIDPVFAEKPLPEPDLDALNLSAGEWREALRACKGRMLRQEVYELDVDALEPVDGRPPQQIPVRLFSAVAHGCGLRCLQPRGDNPYAVFLVTETEALSYHYELDLRPPAPPAGDAPVLQPDPRVAHTLNLSFDEYGDVQQAVAVGYPRWRLFDESDLAAAVDLIRETQRERHVAYTETRYTGDVIDPAPGAAPLQYYRLRMPCEVQTFELTGVAPAAGPYFELAELRSLDLSPRYPATTPARPVARSAYQQLPQSDAATLRLVEHARTLFFQDDLSGPRALGDLGRRGLTCERYKLALTRALLDAIFDAGQLDQDAPTGGTVRDALNRQTVSGYLGDADATARFGVPSAGEYWLRSGVAGFAPDADQHFYLPDRYTDAFGNTAALEYDAPWHLFTRSLRDALGNTVAVARFDYRVLAPAELTDANGNYRAVAFDVLGLPAATAVMGKLRTESGDNLVGIQPDLPPDEVEGFFTRPYDAATPARWLGNATARYVYDFGAHVAADGTVTYQVRPASACGIVRETHVQAGGTAAIQVAVEYSDGLGAVLVKKAQAEPDPDKKPPDPSLRWIATGKTVLNNKGKPVMQFEPYVSLTEHCFDATEAGAANVVTPLMYYDAVGRLVRTELPDGTISRVEFSPWRGGSYDANDTVLESSWYADRGAPGATSPEPADPDQRAAWLAVVHSNTPAQTHLDSLGRTAVAIAHNRVEDAGGPLTLAGRQWRDERYVTFTRLDAEGQPLWIRDARGNLVMQHVRPPKPDHDDPRVPRDFGPGGNPNQDVGSRVPTYDIAGRPLFQHGGDAGDRWMLADAAGQPMFAWDFNERQEADNSFTGEARLYFTARDPLRRPTAQWLRVNTDPPVMVERSDYRDTQDAAGTPNPQLAADQAANLIGQLVRHCDPSGLMDTVRRDFDGNVLEVERQLSLLPTVALVDWQGDPLAQTSTEVFRQISEYDALSRLTRRYNWHRDPASVAVYEPAYNERGLLRGEKLLVRASRTAAGPAGGVNAAKPDAIREIRYDVKGQREYLALGNGSITRYDYDPKTFRLRQLRTTRLAAGQTDPDFPGFASNLSDARVLQQLLYTYDPVGNVTEISDQAFRPVFFDGGIAEPRSRHEYDALYRLTAAEGRETAQGGDAARDAGEPAYGAGFPITDQTLRRYQEAYAYDPAGNFVTFSHAIQGDATNSWTRHYESFPDSNRLHYTWQGSDRAGTEIEYQHDPHGNTRNLARTAPEFFLRWDHHDMIRQVNLGGGGQAYYQYDAAQQRTRKWIKRNGSGVEERIYLGGYELYRRTVAGAVVEEIESHHLMIGDQRVLLVDDVLTPSDAAHPRPDGLVVPAQTLFRYQYGNHLGSACLELDDAAGIISYEEYHPYGTSAYRALNGVIESPPKRYRYTGMERDEESGLAYHLARYYPPWLGRWVNCDPAGLIDGSNVWSYSKNNPAVFIDTNGRQGMHQVDPNLPAKDQIEALQRMLGKKEPLPALKEYSEMDPRLVEEAQPKVELQSGGTINLYETPGQAANRRRLRENRIVLEMTNAIAKSVLEESAKFLAIESGLRVVGFIGDWVLAKIGESFAEAGMTQAELETAFRQRTLPPALAEIELRTGTQIYDPKAAVEGGIDWKVGEIPEGFVGEAFGTEGKTRFQWIAQVPEENLATGAAGNQLDLMKWYAKEDEAVDVYRYVFKTDKPAPAAMSKVAPQPGVPTLGPPKVQYFNPKGFEAYGKVVSKEWVGRLPPRNAAGLPTGR